MTNFRRLGSSTGSILKNMKYLPSLPYSCCTPALNLKCGQIRHKARRKKYLSDQGWKSLCISKGSQIKMAAKLYRVGLFRRGMTRRTLKKDHEIRKQGSIHSLGSKEMRDSVDAMLILLAHKGISTCDAAARWRSNPSAPTTLILILSY